MLSTTATLASRPIYGSDDASVSRLLSRLVDGADGLESLRSAVLLAVFSAAPLLLALACVDERSVLLDGLLGRFDLAEAALAPDRLSCCELRALLAEHCFLLGAVLLLSALALGFPFG